MYRGWCDADSESLCKLQELLISLLNENGKPKHKLTWAMLPRHRSGLVTSRSTTPLYSAYDFAVSSAYGSNLLAYQKNNLFLDFKECERLEA